MYDAASVSIASTPRKVADMTSNSAGGQLSQESILALIWTAFSIAFLFVILRTALRFRLVNRLVTEDYWMFLALATLLTNSILQTFQLPSLYYMSGVISGEITASGDLISVGDNYLRYEFAIIGLFWTVLWCVKASFLAVYFKLFQKVTMYRIAWYVLAAFTFCAYIGCWITAIMSCHPIANFFKFAQCSSSDDVWVTRMSVYFSTTVDIFTDLCIMAMPIKLIYNIRISVKQKAGLVCVFSLCLVMIVFAVTRAKQVLVESYFVNLVLLEIWSTLESSISIVVGCLPVFKSLISSRSHTINGSSNNATKYKSKGSSKLRSACVPLSPFSNVTKSGNDRRPNTTDSQETMVKPSESHSIMVKNDVTVSYVQMDRPLPIYHGRPSMSLPGGQF